jgi:hypothetical protein
LSREEAFALLSSTESHGQVSFSIYDISRWFFYCIYVLKILISNLHFSAIRYLLL